MAQDKSKIGVKELARAIMDAAMGRVKESENTLNFSDNNQSSQTSKEEVVKELKFSKEDAERLTDMAKSGKTDDIVSFMNEAMKTCGFMEADPLSIDTGDMSDKGNDENEKNSEDFSAKKFEELNSKILEMSNKLEEISLQMSAKVDAMSATFDNLATELTSLAPKNKEV